MGVTSPGVNRITDCSGCECVVKCFLSWLPAEFSSEDYPEEEFSEQFDDTDRPDSPGVPKLCIVDPEIQLGDQP